MTATAYSVFYPEGDDFTTVIDELGASAGQAEDFIESSGGITSTPAFDWAFAARFDNEAKLHAWLDSPARERVLADGERRGIRRRMTDLVVVDGELPPAGSAVFGHRVLPGKEAEFTAALTELVGRIESFPGYEGTALFPTSKDGQQHSLMRFRTGRQLAAWLTSAEREQSLPSVQEHLAEQFTTTAQATAFGSTVRVQDGQTKVTPRWKSGMLVLLVLYPTVMLLSRFLGPFLADTGADPGLAMFLSQIVSVVLMTYYFMPWASKPFAKWLDPVEGSGLRISLIGAGTIVAIYLGYLALFLSVQWLQFWDFND